MFDFQIDAGDKTAMYDELVKAAEALVGGEPDGIANMANVAALVWQLLPDINWAGFYRNVADEDGTSELVLGPFQGRTACIRIPFGKGVCGAAAETMETQLVDDVHAFPGHIACDAVSRSELVVPIVRDGALVAVLDIDSPEPGRFDEADKAGCERLCAVIAGAI